MVRSIPNRTTVLAKDLTLIAEETTKEFFSYFDYLCSYVLDFVHEDDRQAFIDLMNGTEDGRRALIRFLRNTGEYHTNVVSVKNLTSDVIGQVTLIELDEALDISSSLSHELRQCYQILSLTNEYTFSFNLNTGLFSINRYSQGYQRTVVEMDFDLWKVKVVEEGIVPEDWSSQLDVLSSELHTASSFRVRLNASIRTENGVMENLLFMGNRVQDSGSITVVGRILSDDEANLVKQSHRLLDELQIDELTQVYNKKTITTFAQKQFHSGHNERFSLCILDLDHFKPINDQFGHLVGDKVLARSASVIKRVVGDDGVVGRFGGDEFMLILYSIENESVLRGILRALIVQIQHEFEGEFEGLELTCSVGCATYPDTGTSYDELFSKADFCLYRAKDKGRNRYVFFRPEMHTEVYEQSKSAKEAGIKTDGREMVELKYMSQFVAELGRKPRDACLTVMHHMVDTYSLDNITIYDRKTSSSLLAAGTSFPLFAHCPYQADADFLARFDENGIYRCDFIEQVIEDGSLFLKIVKEQKVASVVYCMVGDPKDPRAMVAFYRFKPAFWAEYEVHCASIFASALSSIDFEKLKE